MNQDISEVRNGMKQGISEVSNEMKHGFKEVKNELLKVNKRIDDVEKNSSEMFSAIRGRFIVQDGKFEAYDKKPEEM